MATLKEQMAERLTKLQEKRVELVARQDAELAALDRQIAATQQLVTQWDTVSVDEALATLSQTGVRLRLDS